MLNQIQKVEYHKDSDGHLILDENDELIPDTICICAAWDESECCCGAWMKKDYYDWDKGENDGRLRSRD